MHSGLRNPPPVRWEGVRQQRWFFPPYLDFSHQVELGLGVAGAEPDKERGRTPVIPFAPPYRVKKKPPAYNGSSPIGTPSLKGVTHNTQKKSAYGSTLLRHLAEGNYVVCLHELQVIISTPLPCHPARIAGRTSLS